MWILLSLIVLVLLFVLYKNKEKENYCAQHGNVIYSTDAIASTCHDDRVKLYFPLDPTDYTR